MKTYQSSIKQNTKQRGGKGSRWKDASHGKGKILQKGWTIRGMGTNQVFKPPFIMKKYHIKKGKEQIKECLA